MEKKIASGIILTLVVISMLSLVFNVQLVKDFGANYVRADGDKPLNLTDSQESFLSEGFNRNASAEENPKPYSVDEDKWDFDRIDEWGDFAKVDDDSAELIIGLNDEKPNSYAEIMHVITENGGKFVNTVSMGGEICAVVADIPLAATSSFVAEVQAAGLSSYIEPNMKVQAYSVPNDPDWSQQWGPAKIEADYAWNTTLGDSSVLVAVIDSGIDYDHPDLAANYVALGYDWVNEDSDPLDDFGHGTHCAGIIAAEINNGIGIAGLAQVQIMAEKVIDRFNEGNWVDIANAIDHAVGQGADILSLSLGGYGKSATIYEAVKYAYDNGVLVVAAAGNDATNVRNYPAAYDEVVAVTATDEYDNPADFTNFGEWVELAAPGVDIYSTMPTYHVTLNDPPYNKAENYDELGGTSMACPHVAGAAALILSQFPSMTGNQLRLQLRHTADDLGDLGFDIYYGYGRVNARRAVEEVPPDHDLNILRWDRPPYVEPGDMAKVNVTVLNFGFNNESSATVQLLVNGEVVDSTLVDSLLSGATVTVGFSWNPTVDGKYNVTAHVVPVSGESHTIDNSKSAYVNVRSGKFIRVPADCQKIQEAIDLASPREVIKVASGTYYEHLYIDKSVSLVGEDCNATIIDANGIGTVVEIQKSNASIVNFTIRNGVRSGDFPNYGVFSINVQDCKISNCYVTNNYYGIYLIQSSNNTFSRNNITNNSYAAIWLEYSSNNSIDRNKITNNGQYGIYLQKSSSNSIFGNNITNNYWGIWLEYSSNNIISGNNIKANNYYGIYLIQSSNNTFSRNNITNNSYAAIWLLHSHNNSISRNNITNNGYGIYLRSSSNNSIDRNKITNNGQYGIKLERGLTLSDISHNNKIFGNNITNNGEYGIYLQKSSSYNIVSGNKIINNTYGIYIYWYSAYNTISGNEITTNKVCGINLSDISDNNKISGNNITNNNHGIGIYWSSSNIIYHNNLVDNTIQGTEDTGLRRNVWDNGREGNYWSDYAGEDLNQDGIGDTLLPHQGVDDYPLMNPYNPQICTLTITATTGGTTDPAPETYTYSAGSYVNVEALPSANYFFDHWELDGLDAGSANPITVTMDDNHTLQAVFAEITSCTLTIYPPTGGTTNPAPGDYVYAPGTSVSVTAVADRCYVFDHWELDSVDVGSTNPYAVTMDNDHTLYAVFQLLTYNLTILSSTGGATNPTPGTHSYVNGTHASVTAILDAHYLLDYWLLDGNPAGSNNHINVLMTDDHTLQPIFKIHNHTLTVTATTGGTTNPASGIYNYIAGSSVNVTAFPNSGYSFDYWLLDGEEKTENPITVIMDANHTLEAVFADDIAPEISVPMQEPPENVEAYQNVTVTVNVTDLGTGVYNVTLWYSINNGTTWTPMKMTEISANTYQATILGCENGTWLRYKIIAYDKNANPAINDNHGYYFVYHVIPEFPPFLILPIFMITTLLAVIVYRRKHST